MRFLRRFFDYFLRVLRGFSLERFLFALVLLSLPLNLGKHFIFPFAYVNGKLIDYLIPTLYVHDILVFLLLLVALPKLVVFWKGFLLMKGKRSWSLIFLTLFLWSVFLSVVSSFEFAPSFYAYLRLFLYAGFVLYIPFRNFKYHTSQKLPKSLISKVSGFLSQYHTWFAFLILALSVLGILQWLHQGSIFDNYLILGEQPYTFSTPGIVKENFFGVTKIPPYGTFRHPNVFAGFLSFGLLIVFNSFLQRKAGPLYALTFLLGTITLFLTFSWFVMAAFLLSLVVLTLLQKTPSLGNRLIYLVLALLLLLTFILPFSTHLPLLNTSSLQRRSNLLTIGFQLIKQRPLFGIGYNNFTYFVDQLSIYNGFAKFTQPIHNIYMLLLVESGIFSLTFFILFLASLIKNLLNNFPKKSFQIRQNNRQSKPLLITLILHLLLLGGFDHYLLTAHQMQLLFWLTIGIALQYNFLDEV
ncbi:hypothetical protein GF360_00750 [candidate division WWE3 bacterium]|nr:hypothetical protein [candidate division WWE3 bacterium]